MWTLYFSVSALLCECDEFCPDNHFNNYSCATSEGYCFAKLHYDIKNKTTVRTHGCTADTHDGGIFQCRHKKHEKPTEMMCCKDSDYCNSRLDPTMALTTDSKLHRKGINFFFHRIFYVKSFFGLKCFKGTLRIYFNLDYFQSYSMFFFLWKKFKGTFDK